MAESFPRWGLGEVNFVETDPEKIKSEIITAYESASGRSLADGDPVRLFLLTIADRVIHLQNCINIAAQQNLLSYAQAEHLDALGNNLAVKRLPESKAVTTIQFRLSQALGNDYTIPMGFEVTNGIVTFATDEELIIKAGNLTGTMSATCTTAGVVGNNYLAGQVDTIVKPQAFLSEAKNTTTTTGGADEENDEELAERVRLAPNSFSVAGSVKSYKFHALSVSSAIADVAVYSLEEEPGVVYVHPLLSGGEMPSQELLDNVAEYLSSDTIRPLTDLVKVQKPVAKEYTINVDYWIDKSDVAKSTAIQKAVADAVENYRIWQQSRMGRDITPDRLIRDIIGAGAKRIDFSTLSPSQWVRLEPSQVAQCAPSNVTVTYKGTEDE